MREDVARGQKEETSLVAFQTPVSQRPVENTPFTRQNDENSQKNGMDDKVPPDPRGPPVSYGRLSQVSPLPSFTPEQIQQFNGPRMGSSFLPLGRDHGHGGEVSRVEGFLQGFFPGLDHLQQFHEQRQREAEGRAGMESMVEQM